VAKLAESSPAIAIGIIYHNDKNNRLYLLLDVLYRRKMSRTRIEGAAMNELRNHWMIVSILSCMKKPAGSLSCVGKKE
jgi:hypothetical protein